MDKNNTKREYCKNKGSMCNAPCNPPCENEAKKRGLCYAHYQRYLRGMDLTESINPAYYLRKKPKQCSAPCNPPCKNEAVVNGLCPAHYVRQRLGKDIKLPIKPTRAKFDIDSKKMCSNVDIVTYKSGRKKEKPCKNHAVFNGLCWKHYIETLEKGMKD